MNIASLLKYLHPTGKWVLRRIHGQVWVRQSFSGEMHFCCVMVNAGR